jgi:hypothetical protein
LDTEQLVNQHLNVVKYGVRFFVLDSLLSSSQRHRSRIAAGRVSVNNPEV